MQLAQLVQGVDPNLFHLDWERTFEALTLVIILAFVVERVLAVIFENRVYIERVDRPGLKELISVALSIGVCVAWRFDAISIMILTDKTTVPGYALTGMLIAGGSKASIKLFHDLLNVKSSSYDNRHEIKARYAERVAEETLEVARKRPGSAQPGAERKVKALVSRAKEAAGASGSQEAAAAVEGAKAALNEIRNLKNTPSE
ncbi:MAG: hypothetical protein IT439_11835 [Phycisphaerales bacterium]|nr:hypothetical protein [Phycisphaerales bacterium]